MAIVKRVESYFKGQLRRVWFECQQCSGETHPKYKYCPWCGGEVVLVVDKGEGVKKIHA